MPAQILIGTIVAYAIGSQNTPDGWLLCDGTAIDSETYPDLITLIGSNNTPDLRGRTLIGAGSTFSTSPQTDGTFPSFPAQGFVVGGTGGECVHALGSGEVPSHTHVLADGYWSEAGGGNDFNIPPKATNEPTYDSPNAAMGHNNMQPYYVVNYIICAT